jgi:hypothetical protein
LFLKYLIAGCFFLIPVGCTASNNAVPPGFVQGHLNIVSPKPVELADGNALAVTAETYTEYPLIIFSQDGKKEIAWVTADENGNYRVALPPDRIRPYASIWILTPAFAKLVFIYFAIRETDAA